VLSTSASAFAQNPVTSSWWARDALSISRSACFRMETRPAPMPATSMSTAVVATVRIE